MTREEMLAKLKIMTGTTDTEVLSVYLDLASDIVIQKAYPFNDGTVTAVPAKYELVTCEIACYLYNKRGAEGQTSHNENGISRGYESASVPSSMLKRIIPLGKVPFMEVDDESTGTE